MKLCRGAPLATFAGPVVRRAAAQVPRRRRHAYSRGDILPVTYTRTPLTVDTYLTVIVINVTRSLKLDYQSCYGRCAICTISVERTRS